MLKALGAELAYHDAFVPALTDHDLQSQALDGADLALIVTAHPDVDHDGAVASVPLALDLRGVTRHTTNHPATLL